MTTKKSDNPILFFILIIYSTLIYFFDDELSFAIFTFAFILALVISKIVFNIKIKKIIKFVLKMVPLILFITVFNIFFMELKDTFIITLKLLLVCSMTYIYSQIASINGIYNAILKLTYPLKLFKVNTNEIGLIVIIALSYLSRFKEDITNYKYACQIKEMQISLRNIASIISNFIILELKQVDEIENTLIIKQIEI